MSKSLISLKHHVTLCHKHGFVHTSVNSCYQQTKKQSITVNSHCIGQFENLIHNKMIINSGLNTLKMLFL